MICSSVKRFFTSNLLGVGNWTPNWGATQNWVDVAGSLITLLIAFYCQTKRDSELSVSALVGVMTQLQDDLVRIEALAKAADSS
ncbi:hypothetical protein BI317_25425 (plasmid) [Xanthomonas hortorum pv. gardneri]|nr:hypothetical protein BI317_25425 [Xanthomonas hortorum pv. gardneri]